MRDELCDTEMTCVEKRERKKGRESLGEVSYTHTRARGERGRIEREGENVCMSTWKE